MDLNKLVKLREIGYRIPPACATCTWGSFRMGSDYGGCMRHTYNHAKHTDEEMPLSIHKAGLCGDYHKNLLTTSQLGAWEEFTHDED